MPKPLQDNVSRRKASSPLGRAVFVGLRAVDVWWQYRLLTRGWGLQLVQKLNGQPILSDQLWNTTGVHQLQPYYNLVTALALGSSIKQIATILFVSEQETPVSSAILVGVFNTLFNSVNTLLSLWSLTSQAPAPASSTFPEFIIANPLVAVGFSAYLVGILTETVSEFQRRSFKKDPSNKGKPYGGGLFSLATNINYGGYTIWRAGYALVTGGLPLAVITFTFFFSDFVNRGVPVLDEYLTSRYGTAYEEIKSQVKYRLIPGIY